MGQRLVVTVKSQEKQQMKIYYHWDAYTGSAFDDLQKLISVIKPLKEAGKGTSEILLAIIHALEKQGGGIDGGHDSDEWKYIKTLYPDEAFNPDPNRNEGLVSMSEDGMDGAQMWSEGDAGIDIDQETFYNDINFPYDKEEYLKDKVECYELSEEEAEQGYNDLNVYGGDGSTLFGGKFDEIDGKFDEWCRLTNDGRMNFKDKHGIVWEGVL